MKVLIALFLGILMLFSPACSEDSIEKQYEAPADYHMLYDLNETLKEEEFIIGRIKEDGLHLLNKEAEEYKVIPIEDKNIIKKVKYVNVHGGDIYYVFDGFLDFEMGVMFVNSGEKPSSSDYEHIKDNCYSFSIDW